MFNEDPVHTVPEPYEDPVRTVPEPYEDPVRTVPEPSTIWLLGLAGAIAVRNTLFGALTIAVTLLGHALGLNEEDE